MFKLIKNNLQLYSFLLFTIFFLFTYYNSLFLSKDIQLAVFLTIPLYFLTIFEFIYFYKNHGKPRIQDWLRIALFLTTTFNFMTIINGIDDTSTISFVNRIISIENSYISLIIFLIALLALDLGYLIYNSIKKPINLNENFSINKKNLVFTILILTVILEFYLLVTGITGFGNNIRGSSGLGSLIKVFVNYFAPIGLVLSAYIIFIEKEKRKIYKVIFFIMLFLEIFVGLLSGLKENAIAPILYLIIVLLIAGKKLEKKYLYLGVFLLTLYYPVNNAYRDIVSNPFLNTGSSTTNMALAMNQVMTKPLSDTLSKGTESYSSRGNMFPFLFFAIENEEEWNYYKNMNRYIYLPISWFIPRAILENKPKADIGGVLYKQVVGERTSTSITPTSIGWAYLEGSIIYVIFIFIFIGIIFQFFDNKNLKNPYFLLLYTQMIHIAIKPEWDPYFMLNSLIPILIIYWFTLRFIGVKRYSYEN